jgi:hypothetical protein
MKIHYSVYKSSPLDFILNLLTNPLTSYLTKVRAGQSDDQGSIPGVGWEFFSSTPCPNRLWDPPSFQSNGYGGGSLTGIKRPGREADHSPPSKGEVKECLELYFHSPIRLHCVVLS